MSIATPQKFEFQAEIKQLLDIVIHSLYTEKEIFVRELVSNASDALEKLRHTQITEKEIFDDKLDLEINVTTDDKAKTITIQDFGVGMTRAELVDGALQGDRAIERSEDRMERSHEAVAHRLHLGAAEFAQRATGSRFVFPEDVPAARVTEPLNDCGVPLNIGEQDRLDAGSRAHGAVGRVV